MDWRNKPRKKRSVLWVTPEEEFLQVVKSSSSLSQILAHYGLSTASSNYRKLKDRLAESKIDYSHISLGINSNKGRKDFWLKKDPEPLENVLVQNSNYNRTRLKRRLLKEGLLINKCYECGLDPEWNGKTLSLQIDHINGISNDNRLDNLRILCPNCHCQTSTYAGKNIE